MANPVCELLSSKAELERPISWPPSSAGAVLDFHGVVREDESGKKISGIEYEAHATMAQHQLNKLATAAADQFGLTELTIRHRVGFVPTGEASLFVRLAAPHRQETLKAMEWLINELKTKVPIWKHPRVAGESQSSTAEMARA